MGREVLLLRLEGPLQSWGARARWDVRDTELEPTKSGIVGMLGCALGYPVGDQRLETELDAGLRFGVRSEAPGRVAVDYHTVTGFLPTAGGEYKGREEKRRRSLEALRTDPSAAPYTIVSRRSYLQDAAFLVALESRGAPELLGRCAAALREPAWPVFLGRKACIPSRPVFEALTADYEGLEDCLARHPWSFRGARNADRVLRRRPTELDAWVEVDAAQGQSAPRQDALRVNPARIYAARWATRIRVPFDAVAPAWRGGDDGLPVPTRA